MVGKKEAVIQGLFLSLGYRFSKHNTIDQRVVGKQLGIHSTGRAKETTQQLRAVVDFQRTWV